MTLRAYGGKSLHEQSHGESFLAVMVNRFGPRGLTVSLGVLAIVGALRDYLIAGRLLGLAVFAPGAAVAIIDALLWAGLTALSIAVMRAISGPSRADRLARRAGEERERLL